MLVSLGGVLEGNGFSVAKAASGEEGLQKIRSAPVPFALVITDYNLLGINGVEFMRQARKLPGGRFTPILLLTTETEQKKRDYARTAGATGWIVKPVRADKLLQAIKLIVR